VYRVQLGVRLPGRRACSPVVQACEYTTSLLVLYVHMHCEDACTSRLYALSVSTGASLSSEVNAECRGTSCKVFPIVGYSGCKALSMPALTQSQGLPR
jgi:hypothetical protein